MNVRDCSIMFLDYFWQQSHFLHLITVWNEPAFADDHVLVYVTNVIDILTGVSPVFCAWDLKMTLV